MNPYLPYSVYQLPEKVLQDKLDSKLLKLNKFTVNQYTNAQLYWRGLEWDTEHFTVPCCEIKYIMPYNIDTVNVIKLLKLFETQNNIYKFITLRVPASCYNIIWAAEAVGYHLQDKIGRAHV